MTKKKLNLIIVDDNKIFLEGLKFYLEEVKSYNIINTAKDGEEFLNLSNRFNADVILMDIEMPKLNGIVATRKALQNEDFLKIIAITNYHDKIYLSELVQNGFKGCVLKKNIYGQIERAIEKVIEGELFFPYSIQI